MLLMHVSADRFDLMSRIRILSLNSYPKFHLHLPMVFVCIVEMPVVASVSCGLSSSNRMVEIQQFTTLPKL